MATILKSANLNISANAAWGVVDRFMRADIRVFSFIEENRIDGPLRTVISEGGSLKVQELNITTSPEHMYASYTVLELLGTTYHHGSMRVFETGAGRCRFEWITDVLPDSWAVEHGGHIDMLWSDLIKVVETGKEAPRPVGAGSWTDPVGG